MPKTIVAAIVALFIVMSFVPFEFIDLKQLASQEIEVEVRGQVEHSGIYRLPANSTVAQLLEKVQLSENADLSTLNASIILKDRDVLEIPERAFLERISINTANQEQLMMLSGIGIVTANNIIAYREMHGFFQTIDELTEVKGIGEKKLDKIRPYIKL